MILYLDTSALVKRYFKEPFSDEVIIIWKEATEIVTSAVAYAETKAAFHRKMRETHFDDSLMAKVEKDLREDWYSFIRIQVNDELNEYIDKVISLYPLRGFDAIHLSSAKILHEKFHTDLLFACFDKKLNQVAHKEGIQTFPNDNSATE